MGIRLGQKTNQLPTNGTTMQAMIVMSADTGTWMLFPKTAAMTGFTAN